MPRYVLLYHDCPPEYARPSHWDLMLEADGVLHTWALARLPRRWAEAWVRTARDIPSCPPLSESDEAPVERLPDHRIAYLKEQGPLSGSRGEVARIAEGTYELLAESASSRRIALSGGVLPHGEIVFEAAILRLIR
jgi:hypothetical protein